MKIQNNIICRGCMATDKPLQSIYECSSICPNLQIVNILLRNIPELLIRTTDGLPKALCVICIDKLLSLHQFREMCIASNIYLQSIIENNGFEKSRAYSSANSVQKINKDPLQLSYALKKSVKVELEEVDVLIGEQSSFSVATESLKMDQTINSNLQRLDLQTIKRKDFATFFNSNNVHLKNQYQECVDEIENKESCQIACIQNTINNVINKDSYKIKKVEYNCAYCSSTFLKKSSLGNHLKTHLELESSVLYKCKECLRSFKSRRTLLKHNRNDHPVMRDLTVMYNCKFCSKVFQQSSTLKDHIRTHTGEQPFLCFECGKTFSNSSNMKQHLLRHTGEKKYECPDCPKKFPCLSDLASHSAVHKKFKPHICDVCGAAFGKPFQLKKHKMYHNGEKPHKCEYCDMRFVIADHMRRHMRTHTGEKPYKCKYCQRAFTQSNDLIKHLRSHLGENVYKCEFCPKAFRLASELREHFAEHKISESGYVKTNKANTNNN
ncbi:zinc finger protein 660-like isoform X1 [Teleopsis dalmanni]|uniref:zinc finger protein 660-like isoform X1 n=2 Tax=Teleopsis dalmanni TaxID=139649 RepID=UPI0018CD9A2E|nr:zinc finger protein 660-like isoform X1 [Teleopsis dalmanni]XP_037932781.1 zinc finger protein 660-like isoform X1 [Teleopsis dalmanni]XP_037939085.1 zinc finger protein 660-like isoform X1 [Teleopsis dalmanni]XP_037939086.1 zinc finger protein 660-like isoform X1 [Teleopsis dalmanni]